MAEKKKRGKRAGRDVEPAAPCGAVPAVPPPDDPMGRSEGGQGDVGNVEAAALRVEAIRRTRLMPSDDDPPPAKKQR